MKAFFIAIPISASPAMAQIDRQPTVPDTSIPDQIKAARTKETTDEQNDRSKRAWIVTAMASGSWEAPAKLNNN